MGQAEAMGLFPGREDQPLTAWSQHRDEQPWKALDMAVQESQWHCDTDFMKEDAQGLLALWRWPVKAGQAWNRGFGGLRAD